MPIVIAACSNRKRNAPTAKLHAARLPSGTAAEVAAAWARRVAEVKTRMPATELYSGRSFSLARGVAEHLGARFFVASAGLAVVPAEARVPSYDLTVAGPSGSNVLRRLKGVENPASRDWWTALCGSLSIGTSIRNLADGAPRQLVLLALPSAYLEMVADDLAALADARLARLRIFTGGDAAALPERLWPAVMPYDSRLDGPDSPLPGTRSDFAARALSHFATNVLKSVPRGALQTHRRSVAGMIARWRYPDRPRRIRQSDDELLSLIRKHWEEAERSKTRLLRLLRDDLGIACEQARFSQLVDAAGMKAPR